MSFRRIAIIMAGGSGERFWPVSRREHPKQLLKLADPDKSLLQQTIDRISGLVRSEDIYIATAPHLAKPIKDAMPNLGEDQILAEPHKRNTGGCLVWVAANLLAKGADPDSTSMAILAADHRVTPDAEFCRTVDAALITAETSGGLVTVGIPPTRPETGYGYIEQSDSPPAMPREVPVFSVSRFREKPDIESAKQFVASGKFFWNSGTFYWTLRAFLTNLEKHSPELYAGVHSIADALRGGDIAAADQLFASLPNLSIDYALMEKAESVYVARATFEWDDVGAWDAVERAIPLDDSHNVSIGENLLIDTAGSIVLNYSDKVITCAVGLEDITIVVTDDAVMVCPKNKVQDVKKIVEKLKETRPDLT